MNTETEQVEQTETAQLTADVVQRLQAPTQTTEKTKKTVGPTRRNVVNVVAAVIFTYILASTLAGSLGGLGSLNRYIIEDHAKWDAGAQQGMEFRETTLRGPSEAQVLKELTRLYPTSQGWSKPYIEDNDCLVFETHRPSSDPYRTESIIAVSHCINTRHADVKISRTRPLTALQNLYASLKEDHY